MSDMTSSKNKWFRWGFAGVLVAGAFAWYLNSGHVSKDGVAPDESPTVSEKLRTEDRARKIGQVLIEKNFELTRFVEVAQKRNVASEALPVQEVTSKVSEGQYGRDAWGHPFFFKVVDGKVIVWSKGENHELDSSDDQIMSNNAAGDDIIVSVNL